MCELEGVYFERNKQKKRKKKGGERIRTNRVGERLMEKGGNQN